MLLSKQHSEEGDKVGSWGNDSLVLLVFILSVHQPLQSPKRKQHLWRDKGKACHPSWPVGRDAENVPVEPHAAASNPYVYPD